MINREVLQAETLLGVARYDDLMQSVLTDIIVGMSSLVTRERVTPPPHGGRRSRAQRGCQRYPA